MKQVDTHFIDVHIDQLTNSILHTASNERVATAIMPVVKDDLLLLTRKNGWLFDWRKEHKNEDRKVYKLTLESDSAHGSQGLISLSNYHDHFYVHLVESAPKNLGQHKVYAGVAGNLFAFACKESLENGCEGVIAFQSKTKLIEHYQQMLKAVHVGGHKMIIFPQAAISLIHQYFPQE